MAKTDNSFLEEAATVVPLLFEEKSPALEQIYPFLPFKGSSADDLRFQEAILNSLPKPIRQEHLNRFLEVYCTDPHHFSELMVMISGTNPILVSTCWDNVFDFRWDQWYANLEHGKHWSTVLQHLSMADRLEFFEKLTCANRFDANEFCDFLLTKNKACSLNIWRHIPEAQWNTWIKNNGLPATTCSLVKTMPYPLGVSFFKAMLQMTPVELASLCVAPDRTIEQFYPTEVAVKIAESTTVSDVKAKLVSLKENQHHQFDENLINLVGSVEHLSAQLDTICAADLNPPSGLAYGMSFFKSNSHYKFVNVINVSKKSLLQLHPKTLNDPIFPVARDEPKTAEHLVTLNQAITKVRERLTILHSNSDAVACTLQEAFTAIEAVFSELDKLNVIPPKTSQSSQEQSSLTEEQSRAVTQSP
jgi:hypothetical protein